MRAERAELVDIGPSLTTSPLDATLMEVKQLLSFVDGAVVMPETREYLWRSWGFCPRHTWLLATVECELRIRPFGTTIVYQDLTRRAGTLLSIAYVPEAVKLQRLRGRLPCPTCDYLAIAHSNPAWSLATECVNRRRRVKAFLAATHEEWVARTCPVCLGGDGPVCRPHMLGGGAALGDTGRTLRELAIRLRTYDKSLAWQGPAATPRDVASLVEALGWFAGWAYPAALLAEEPEPAPAALVQLLPLGTEATAEISPAVDAKQACPECGSALDLLHGSSVSGYFSGSIQDYVCHECSWSAPKCGDTDCDGYMTGTPSRRGFFVWTCIECGWNCVGKPFRKQ